ncbi:MAG TPA: DUF4344 domain-containing metallopeptidase [Kofleriaceae bacterium]
MRLAIPLLLCALAAPAFADVMPTIVETHGIEIEIPTGWSVTNKGSSTTISPTKYKGRAIEVIEADKPLSKEFIIEVLKAAHVENPVIKEGQRNGAPAISGTGTITVKDKKVDVDLLAVPNALGHATLLVSFIKGDQDPALRELNDKLLLSARVAGPKLTLVVEKPHTKGISGVPDDYDVFLGKLVTSLDTWFRLPRAVPVRVRECGVVNAFYNPADHTISVCHELWDDTVKLFKGAGMDDAKAVELTHGMMTFTFMHEFGHALVGEFGLPITGKGEDAADEIATIFLGFAGDMGPKAALSGASWFQTMAAKPGAHNLFYDEHSFNDQRVISITCLLYGSDQKRYTKLMTDLKVPQKRLNRCVNDYRDRLKAWDSLLDVHLRKPKKQ